MFGGPIYGVTQTGARVPFLLNSDGSLAMSEEQSTPWAYSAATGGITNTSAVTLSAAKGQGYVNVCTFISVHNKSAVPSEFTIADSISGTALYLGYAPSTMTVPMVLNFGKDGLTSSPNGALTFVCATTATATYVNACGYSALASSEASDNISGSLGGAGAGVLTLFDDNGAAITDDSGATITLQ